MCDKCKKECNKKWLQLYKGFMCRQCDSYLSVALRINKQEQLEYSCNKCGRRWI